MDFIHKETEIVLQSETGEVLAQITFPYENKEKNVVIIDHTFVDASLRGQGIAGKLMTETINELKKRNLKIIPACSYAAAWFEKHPEFSYLLKQ